MPKWLKVTISILIICIFAGVGVWLGFNFDKLKMAFSGTNLYTFEDLENAKNEGYTNGVKDKAKYEQLVNEYKDKYSNLKDEHTETLSKLAELTAEINSLTELKNRLFEQIKALENNDFHYSSENVEDMLSELITKYEEVCSRLTEIESFKTELESQIEVLNSQIESLKKENQVLVTFKYNGSVLESQVIEKGTSTTLKTEKPQDTDYLKFVYWEVDGSQIELGTYLFNSDTIVEAKLDRFFDVKFFVDDRQEKADILKEGSEVTLPSTPQKEYYEFLGWSTDKEHIFDFENYSVSENISFYAMFKQLPSKVQFKYENDVVDIQTVEVGAFASRPITFENSLNSDYVTTKFEYYHDGQKIDDLSNYPINKSMDITIKIVSCSIKLDSHNFNVNHFNGNAYSGFPCTDIYEISYSFDFSKIFNILKQKNFTATESLKIFYRGSDGAEQSKQVFTNEDLTVSLFRFSSDYCNYGSGYGVVSSHYISTEIKLSSAGVCAQYYLDGDFSGVGLSQYITDKFEVVYTFNFS